MIRAVTTDVYVLCELHRVHDATLTMEEPSHLGHTAKTLQVLCIFHLESYLIHPDIPLPDS